MPQRIEPMLYKETKNIDEHRQIVNKMNECIGQLNNIGEVPVNVGERLDSLDVKAKANEDRSIANEQSIAGHTQDIADVMGGVANNEADILQLKDEAEAMANETVDRIDTDLAQGKTLKLNILRGSGESQPQAGIDLPFMDTATLIPGAGDFTFKLDMVFKDGSHIKTNDMVLPTGGGETVPISGVIIKEGSSPDKFVVAIVLETGVTIDSNEYALPGGVDAYDKTTSDSRYVRVGAVDQDINGRKNFVISPYVPDLKPEEIVPGSKRAVNAGQVHEAFVNADNKSNGIDAKVDAIGVSASIVEGSAPGKNAVSVTVNGKTSKTEDLPGGSIPDWKLLYKDDAPSETVMEYPLTDRTILDILNDDGLRYIILKKELRIDYVYNSGGTNTDTYSVYLPKGNYYVMPYKNYRHEEGGETNIQKFAYHQKHIAITLSFYEKDGIPSKEGSSYIRCELFEPDPGYVKKTSRIYIR